METCIEKLEKVSAEIDKLFDKVKDETGETEVVMDGIIDIPKYGNSKYKILWVLKEAYDADGGYDMRKGLSNRIKTIKKTKPTFLPIIYTSYGILNDCNWDFIPDLDKDDQSVADIIENVAFVNVKKLPGGATTIPAELKKAYDLYGSLVRKQINDYDPDIVVLCYVANLLTQDLGLTAEFENELLGTKYWIKNNKLYIRTNHPAQRGNRKEYCEAIMNVVNVWKQKIEIL